MAYLKMKRHKKLSPLLGVGLYALVSIQSACITVNMPKDNDPESWPTVHLYPDEKSWQVSQSDPTSATFKHRTRQTTMNVISLCDHYLTDKTPASLLESAKFSFPDATPLETSPDLATALAKIPYPFEHAYLKIPSSDQQVFLLTLKSANCVEDIIVKAPKLESSDFQAAISLARSLKEGPVAKKDRFVLNEQIPVAKTKDQH